ncbi:MAG: mechanosensitive ion channel [Gammaproteobacteria bacterium]|nr:mechanosensitive ion channel [Gammaproteobacteria bacterium]MDH3407472.1 mechanosensitive ion channel [Gammaproteobacteria bacterium]MDH3561834.1 mechanosensitive ion channel [Gammaproteobacteria bacterium]
MNSFSEWRTTIDKAFSGLTERLGENLPNFIGALLLIFAGWLVGKLLRALTVRLIHLLDHAMRRLSTRYGDRPGLLSASADVLGSIVFWVTVLFFLTAATQVLGLDAFLGWLNRVVAYLPTLLTGGLIVLAGFLLSALVRDVVTTTAPVGDSQRMLLGRVSQLVILITAVVIGADQIGIKVTFLVIMVTVLASALLGGLALALSLGSRTYVSNLIGAHYLQQQFRVGQSVRIGHFEGRILEFTATAIVLETADGRVNLPAKIYNEEPIVLLMGGQDGSHP